MSQGATPEGVPDGNGKTIDWEAIERDYRAGVLSVRQIGRNHGVSHTAVQKRADKEAWNRDLSTRVRAEVQRRLATDAVASEPVATAVATPVATPYAHADAGNLATAATATKAATNAATQAATDRQIVDAAAATAVEVVRSHRRDIGSGRALANLLRDQLLEAATQREAIEAVIHAETAGTEGDGAKEAAAARAGRAQMLRAVSLPQHMAVVRDFSVAMKNFVTLERSAFNIPDVAPTEPPPPGNQPTATDYDELRRLLLADKEDKARAGQSASPREERRADGG